MVRNPHHSALAAAALGLLLLLLACGASPPVPRWTPAGSSSVGRYIANAVLLPSSGKVLVMAGATSCLRRNCYRTLDEQDTVLADLYDPVTGTWAATGSLAQARARATAALLPGRSSAACPACGKVLVAGGFSGVSGPLDSAELYDPATGEWAPTGAMRRQRIFAASAVLESGQVLVVGGAPDAALLEATSSAELFDPKTGTWTPTGAMHEARTDHVAIRLPSGKVLVAGGAQDGLHNVLSSAEVYDPATASWTPTGSMSRGRYDFQAVLLGSGKVLVAGGAGTSAEIYDPAADAGTGAWAPARPMAHVRSANSATLLHSGLVLVAGGTRLAVGEELYDPVTDTWRPAGEMSAPREYHLATLLPSGGVLVVGGSGGPWNSTDPFPLASAEVFSLE